MPALLGGLALEIIKWLGPGYKQIPPWIKDRLDKSKMHLKTLAEISEKGPGKIFIGTPPF